MSWPSSPERARYDAIGRGPGEAGPVTWITGWQDHAVLYVAAAVGLSLPLLMWGLASGSLSTGATGALLVAAGIGVSSRLSRYRLLAAPLGAALGVLACVTWWRMTGPEAIGMDEDVRSLIADAGVMMARRMAVLVIGLSFCAVRPTVIGFALVPGVTVFGLASGRLEGNLVGAMFCGYLACAVVILAWAMLAPEELPEALRGWRAPRSAVPTAPLVRPGGRGGRPVALGGLATRPWRARHMVTVATLLLTCLALGYLLSIPMAVLGALYRWTFITAMTPEGSERVPFALLPREETRRFPVGGGPKVLSETAMLAVSGEPSQYWRGLTYDEYTGSGWMRWQREVPVGMEGNVADLSGHFAAPSSSRRTTHTVRVEVSQPYIIHSPGQVQRAVLPLPQYMPSPVQTDPFGGLQLPGAMLTPGDVYEIESVPLGAEGPGALLAGAPRKEGDESAVQGPPGQGDRMPGEDVVLPPSQAVSSAYERVPLSAVHVAELAKQVAGAEPTPEAKLEALVRYLQENCVYSLDAPAIPAGEDAADYFVFRQKRGRCDLFATALAVMARGVGIPTRLATGYLEGVYDRERDAYLLRECDQHAWVEAYVPARGGWITVDATPGVAESTRQPRGLRLLWLRARFFSQDHPWAASGMVVALVGLVVLAVVLPRRLRAIARSSVLLGQDARTAVVRAYWQFLNMLRRRGFARRASQTPLEYLAALGAAMASQDLPPLPAAALPFASDLTEVFVTARYGPGPVTEEQANAAHSALGEMRQSLRRRQQRGA